MTQYDTLNYKVLAVLDVLMSNISISMLRTNKNGTRRPRCLRVKHVKVVLVQNMRQVPHGTIYIRSRLRGEAT